MKNKILIWLSAAVLSGVFLSCNQVPQKEIDALNLSMRLAKSAGADLYLPHQFDALQDSMGALMEALVAEKSNVFAKYRDIKEPLNVLAITANQLTDSTESEKIRISDEIRFTMEQIQVLIQETRMLSAAAPKGKESQRTIQPPVLYR